MVGYVYSERDACSIPEYRTVVPLHCCRNVTEHHTTFCTITKQSFTVYIKYTLANVTLFRPLTLGRTTLILNKGDFEFVY